MRILVVEDEPELYRPLRRALEAERHVVEIAADGATGLAAALGGDYDLLILDLGLPDQDGLDICRRMRAHGRGVPILALTARDEVTDRVTGLDAGVDDYMGKPFALAELLARVRALGRRPPAQQDGGPLRLADLRLDMSGHRIWRGERPVPLSATEFALLAYLLQHAGQVLTRQQILDHVWGYDFEGQDTIVDTYIYYLRHKIDQGEERPLVQTVRGVGYVLRAE